MLSKEDQISILAHLSKADKVVAEEEFDLILMIAKGLGFTEEEAVAILNDPLPIPKLKTLPSDEKFEYLVTIIQLMKIDGRIHQNEVSFCEKLAMRLGYKPGVISNLSAYIYKDPSMITDRTYLRAIADQHIITTNEDEE